MKKIKIKDHIVIVDDEDYEKVKEFKWSLFETRKGTKIRYAIRSYRDNGKTRTMYMHRLIMCLDRSNRLDVDHLNHNGLDNRKENLRVCSRAENLANRTIYKEIAGPPLLHSSYTGVNWYRRDKVWVARSCIEGKVHYFGSYKKMEDAIRAVKERKKLR